MTFQNKICTYRQSPRVSYNTYPKYSASLKMSIAGVSRFRRKLAEPYSAHDIYLGQYVCLCSPVLWVATFGDLQTKINQETKNGVRTPSHSQLVQTSRVEEWNHWRRKDILAEIDDKTPISGLRTVQFNGPKNSLALSKRNLYTIQQ